MDSLVLGLITKIRTDQRIADSLKKAAIEREERADSLLREIQQIARKANSAATRAIINQLILDVANLKRQNADTDSIQRRAIASFLLNEENDDPSELRFDIYQALSTATDDLRSLNAHFDEVQDVLYDTDKDLLFSAGSDGYIRIWRWGDDSNNYENIHSFRHSNNNIGIRALALDNRERRFLLSGDNNGRTYLWDTWLFQEGSIQTTFLETRRIFTDAAVDQLIPNGHNQDSVFFFAISTDGQVAEITVLNEKIIDVGQPSYFKGKNVLSLSASPETILIAFTDLTGYRVQLLNPAVMTIKHSFDLDPDTKINTSAFAKNGRHFALGRDSSQILFLENKSGIWEETEINLSDGEEAITISNLSFVQNDKYLVAIGTDNNARVWEIDPEVSLLPTESQPLIIDIGTWGKKVAEIPARGAILAVAGRDHSIKVFSFTEDSMVEKISHSMGIKPEDGLTDPHFQKIISDYNINALEGFGGLNSQ